MTIQPLLKPIRIGLLIILLSYAFRAIRLTYFPPSLYRVHVIYADNTAGSFEAYRYFRPTLNDSGCVDAGRTNYCGIRCIVKIERL